MAMSKQEFDIDPGDHAQWRECVNTLTDNDNKRLKVTIEVMDNRKRTLPQNAALHKYCELLASALNESGQDMKRVLKPEVDIPWSPKAVKDHLWRPIQTAMYPEKESTADLSTTEVSQVYETLNRHTSQKLGVGLDFPDRRG